MKKIHSKYYVVTLKNKDHFLEWFSKKSAETILIKGYIGFSYKPEGDLIEVTYSKRGRAKRLIESYLRSIEK